MGRKYRAVSDLALCKDVESLVDGHSKVDECLVLYPTNAQGLPIASPKEIRHGLGNCRSSHPTFIRLLGGIGAAKVSESSGVPRQGPALDQRDPMPNKPITYPGSQLRSHLRQGTFCDADLQPGCSVFEADVRSFKRNQLDARPALEEYSWIFRKLQRSK